MGKKKKKPQTRTQHSFSLSRCLGLATNHICMRMSLCPVEASHADTNWPRLEATRSVVNADPKAGLSSWITSQTIVPRLVDRQRASSVTCLLGWRFVECLVMRRTLLLHRGSCLV